MTTSPNAVSPAHPTQHHRRRLAACAASAVWLAACGGGDGGAPAVPPMQPLLNTLNAAGASTTIEARTSMLPASGGEPAAVFDDFQLTAAAQIATVRWQGIYCVQLAGAAAPAPTATEFIVSFHADVSGRPNTASSLLQARFTPSQAAQTLERRMGGLSCGSATDTHWVLYDYSATLPSAFAAAAGTRYWVRVQAVTPSADVYWGWRSGTNANAQSVMLFLGAFDVFTLDRALQLAP